MRMEIKTNIKFNIRMRIKCPKCGEKFDKPEGDTASLLERSKGSQSPSSVIILSDI